MYIFVKEVVKFEAIARPVEKYIQISKAVKATIKETIHMTALKD